MNRPKEKGQSLLNYVLGLIIVALIVGCLFVLFWGTLIKTLWPWLTEVAFPWFVEVINGVKEGDPASIALLIVLAFVGLWFTRSR